MLAVDSKELNKQMRQEVEENKTYSKTMGKDGEYTYGKNYVPKELGIGKKSCIVSSYNNSTEFEDFYKRWT